MTALEGKALLDHGRTIARRYARRVGPELAEELRAEAVLRALGSPPPDGHMEPWLERIYRNLFVDRWRRGQIRTVEIADLPQPDSVPTPEERLLFLERRRVVRSSLSKLPRESRRALLSRYYGEIADDLAAAQLGIAQVTLRTRIHRALARLRVRLADLRAWCPPILGKLGTQAAAVGLAPVMVAALVVTGASGPKPAPVSTATVAIVVPHQARGHVRTPAPPEKTIAEPTPIITPANRTERNAKRNAPAPAREPSSPRAHLDDETTISEILQPDVVDVFAEPERPTAPSMVEAPPSFLAQIDKSIEELL